MGLLALENGGKWITSGVVSPEEGLISFIRSLRFNLDTHGFYVGFSLELEKIGA